LTAKEISSAAESTAGLATVFAGIFAATYKKSGSRSKKSIKLDKK
jgi:hypothetical protein